ncbi:hypothetical protein GYMLUDRAFT_85143 [Collybiopsis luxurians FD-317 M1]|uniref:Uncharacterized protein n=1 Tax=Collybiopsis luxurians FD-317 M1 TaxID=944289 RepID=A0A0D0CF20_9AGAR|nr:hypothetical protein GYMLUDRAFT_85143 [Collybiopsis luxurians FD-317 M1]
MHIDSSDRNLHEYLSEDQGNRLVALVEARLSSLSIRFNDSQPHSHSLKQLNGDLQVTLNMLKFEFYGAPGSRQKDFLPLLTCFDATLNRCEELVERLNRRNTVLAIALSLYDSENIKRCREEVKEKGLEIRARITQLKEHWPDHAPSSPSNPLPTPSIAQESGATHLNPLHASDSLSSQAPSLHSFSSASIRSIQESQFNSAANDLNNTTYNCPPSIVNNGGSVVFNFNFGLGHPP